MTEEMKVGYMLAILDVLSILNINKIFSEEDARVIGIISAMVIKPDKELVEEHLHNSDDIIKQIMNGIKEIVNERKN